MRTLLAKTAAYRQDVSAGLVVFLVALPLCLGIALASGAPLQAGIVAGVVGGIVVTFFSGSELSVSGPAAGLAVVVAAAISSLGSFNVFLLAVMLAGLLQIGLGYLRAGILGNYIPNSVIRGMLAAIGLLIILKQLPHALGLDAAYFGEQGFKQLADGRNTFQEISAALGSFNGEAIIISVVAFVVLWVWNQAPFSRWRWTRMVPAALVVVVLGIVLNELFRLLFADFYLRAEDGHLVNLPQTSLGGFFTWPDFTAWQNPAIYKTTVVLAAVASVETLLSLEATDRLDPRHRISDANRELRAQGIGNVVSGLLGGLPITSVIVRSSANIFAGAQTRLSAFTHGLLLALFVALIPGLLNRIPLAALAAILIVIGYGLTPPTLYREMVRKGAAQAVPFFVTVVAILFTDLLVGIGIGWVVGLGYALRTHHNAAFTLSRNGTNYYLRFNKDATFVHKTELKTKLRQLPGQCTLVVDAHRAHFIDNDIYDVLAQFRLAAPYRHIGVTFLNFERPELLQQNIGAH